MLNKSEQDQWEIEADRVARIEKISELSGAVRLTDGVAVSRDERVSEPSPCEYLPNQFLRKTASKEVYDDLCALLELLRNANAEYAGEFTKEAEAYLVQSGQLDGFAQEAKRWCDRYFSHRVRRRNARDENNSAARYLRLLNEYDSILGSLQRRENSVNYALLAECNAYVAWLLCYWCEARTSSPPPLQEIPLFLPHSHGTVLSKCEKLYSKIFDLSDHLAEFLGFFQVSAEESETTDELISKSQALSRLASMASDIQYLRPFLVGGYKVEDSVVQVGVDTPMYLAWNWCFQYGIGTVVAGQDLQTMLAGIASGLVSWRIVVRSNGELADGQKPWITCSVEDRLPGIDPVALSLRVVEPLHEKLLHLFSDRIDSNRILNDAKQRLASEQDIDELQFALLTTEGLTSSDSYESLAEKKSPNGRIRPMRLSVLLRKLQDHFACEIKGGKGSEITVFRDAHGAKKRTIGCHGADRDVQANEQKRILKALAIPPTDWFDAIGKRRPTLC